MSSSNTICNDTSPPLVDVGGFGPLCITVSLTILKRVYQGEISTPYKQCFVPLSNRYGISQNHSQTWSKVVFCGLLWCTTRWGKFFLYCTVLEQVSQLRCSPWRCKILHFNLFKLSMFLYNFLDIRKTKSKRSTSFFTLPLCSPSSPLLQHSSVENSEVVPS